METLRVALGDIAEVTKLAGFEFTKHIEYLPDGEIIAIRGLNVKKGILDLTDIKRISIKASDLLPRSKLFKNDLVLTYTGTIGEVALITEDDRFHLAPNVAVVRPSGVNPYYLYCYMRSRDFKREFETFSVGSTQKTVPMKNIRQVEIPLLPEKTQIEIGRIISLFDDKIELNQKMNQTLEEIARAIFKSWFVDFDPVRAKAEGRPTGLPPEISDLFPDELVDSEIGEIPKGWEVKTIADLADCVGGATPSTKKPEFWENGHHTWTSPKDLSDSKSIHLLKTDRKITDAGLRKISSGLLPVGTVLLSSRAPVGYLALTTEPTAINQGYIALKPQSRISNFFLLHWCESNLDEIKNRASGTTFAEISKAAFRPIPAIEPSNSAMEKFHDLVSPIYERVLVASKEMETLAKLRDTLLPKLISGDLRIPDAEKFLEVAGI